MVEIIAALEGMFAEKGAGRVEMPPKPGIHTRPDAFIHAMPAYIPALAAAGMNVVLVARRAPLLAALSDELARRHGTETLVVAADLSKPNAAARIKSQVEAKGVRIRLLVNNAGAGRMGRFEGTRTFTVNVDPLIGSMTNFRIYSQRYEIAVNPAVPGTMPEIRHAFLHFLLDPFPFDDRADVDSKRYLLNYAVKAPRLPELYKYDIVSYVDECLVRAVELHLQHLSSGDLSSLLDRDDRDGYLMVRPIYYALDTYTRQAVPLNEYFPRLMKSIDVRKEGEREEQVVFSPADTASKGPAAPVESAADQMARWLDLGDQQIATQDAKGAIASFEHVLKLEPKNPRALYGLAIASALNGQGKRAHDLFTQIVQPPISTYADPSILSWSHVYLGRMNDLAGLRTRAVAEYHAALAVSGVFYSA